MQHRAQRALLLGFSAQARLGAGHVYFSGMRGTYRIPVALHVTATHLDLCRNWREEMGFSTFLPDSRSNFGARGVGVLCRVTEHRSPSVCCATHCLVTSLHGISQLAQITKDLDFDSF